MANTFIEHVSALATPVLVTLRSHLPARLTKARVRVYLAMAAAVAWFFKQSAEGREGGDPVGREVA